MPWGGSGQPGTPGAPNSETVSGAAKNPKGLRAYYAKRLDSGDVLISNGYFGRTRYNTEAFQGEVVQVDGTISSGDHTTPGFGFSKTNLGFGSYSIHFQLPPIQGSRGLVVPVFADRR